jgi:ribonuclease HI
MLTLEFDGLFRGAPTELHLGSGAGFMCYGWVIFHDGLVVARGHGGYARGHNASSNAAEYLALIEGLEALLDMHAENDLVLVCGDAKSVIEQMQGFASVSANGILPLHRKAQSLAEHFQHVYWNWTPRRDNHAADALTRRALRQINDNPKQYQSALQAMGRRRGGEEILHPLLDLRLYQVV